MSDEVEKVWREFWEPIVIKDSQLDLEQIKKELYDFYCAMQEVPRVYCHITGNNLSKITYKAEVVIDAADDHYAGIYEGIDEHE